MCSIIKQNYYMDSENIIFRSDIGFHYRHTTTTVEEILNGLRGVTHSHSQYEIYYLISGNVNYHVAGKTYQIEKGTMLILNAFESHSLEFIPTEAYERRVIEFSLNNIPTFDGFNPSSSFLANKSPVHILTVKDLEKTSIVSLMENIEEEYKKNDQYTNYNIVFNIISIICQIARCISKESNQTIKEIVKVDQEYVNNAIQFINDNLDRDLTIDDIAISIGLSRSYLQHIFKKTMNKSITTYISQQKLHLAKYMLSRGDDLTTVAESLGYQYYSTFSKKFKKLYGVSPKASQKTDTKINTSYKINDK